MPPVEVAAARWPGGVARDRADRAARACARSSARASWARRSAGDVIVGLDHREARLAREALGAFAREQHVAAVAQHGCAASIGCSIRATPTTPPARAPALHHRGVERDVAVAVERAAATRR